MWHSVGGGANRPDFRQLRMLQTETSPYITDLHPLHASIIRVLAYYDLFAYPLKSTEIYTYLPTGGASEHEMERALVELTLSDAIGEDRGLYFLPHRTSAVVDRRLRMEEEGRRMWGIARKVAGGMSMIPFVRGVFVSGQLCRYIADEESDIDYFIVTEPGRLWIVRTICAVLRRTLFLNSRKYFCTNYFISSTNLHVNERSPYIACEVASLKPLLNRELYDRFMEANTWIADYYPNFSLERLEIRRGARQHGRVQRMLEAVVPERLASITDLWLMNLAQRFRERKYPNRRPETYDVSLRARPDESRTFPNDQAPMIHRRYQDELRRHGLTHD